MVVFSETWLKGHTLNSEIFCDHYVITRKDRKDKIGGGVLIAIRNSLSHAIIPSNFDDIEFVAVSVNVLSTKIYITCSYIPPSSEFNIYEKHLGAITEICSMLRDSDSILILGDFNLPTISWLPLPETGYFTALTPSDWTSDFINIISSLSLLQINGITNSINRTLDLVLVNNSDNFDVSRADILSNPEDLIIQLFQFVFLAMLHYLVQQISIGNIFASLGQITFYLIISLNP